MDVPSTFHPVWRDIVRGRQNYQFEFLGARILQGTLRRRLAKDPALLEKCAAELREIYAQNADLPSAQADLKKIFGQGIADGT